MGRAHFEKVTGYEMKNQRSFRLLTEPLPGISVQCARLCKADLRCHGFNLDYSRNECNALEGIGDTPRLDLRQTPGVAYFEGICLRGK